MDKRAKLVQELKAKQKAVYIIDMNDDQATPKKVLLEEGCDADFVLESCGYDRDVFDITVSYEGSKHYQTLSSVIKRYQTLSNIIKQYQKLSNNIKY